MSTHNAAGEPEREALMELLTSSQHAPMSTHNPLSGECEQCPWPLHELGPDAIADAILAKWPRREPEPREVTLSFTPIEGWEDWETGQPNGVGTIESSDSREWFSDARVTHRRRVQTFIGPWEAVTPSTEQPS